MTWDEPTPRPQDDSSDEAESQLTGCQPPLWLVGVMLVILMASCVMGVELMGIVRAFISPPSAPLPANTTRLEQESLGERSTLTTYQTDLLPCEVVEFYQEQGGVCTFYEGSCANGEYERPIYEAEFFATCERLTEFSIFGQRWQARLIPNYNPNPTWTRFELQNDLLWGGFVPTPSLDQP